MAESVHVPFEITGRKYGNGAGKRDRRIFLLGKLHSSCCAQLLGQFRDGVVADSHCTSILGHLVCRHVSMGLLSRMLGPIRLSNITA
jgi:hypothetical protein